MTAQIHTVSRRKGAPSYPPGVVIYVGDRVRFHVDEASPLANRVNRPPRDASEDVRQRALGDYREWLWQEYQKPGAVRDEIDRIYNIAAHGNDVCLECWCHPLPCHADVVGEFVLWLLEQKQE